MNLLENDCGNVTNLRFNQDHGEIAHGLCFLSFVLYVRRAL